MTSQLLNSTRRSLLVTGLASAASAVFDPLAAISPVWASDEDQLDRYLPFRPYSPEYLAHSSRKVFAHWHFFPISFENKPAGLDYYDVNFLKPEGENNKYLYSGGLIRERPLPRAPRSDPDWLVLDMIDDMRSAAAIGVDAFQLNLPDLSERSSYWSYFMAMLAATKQANLPIKVIPCIDCTSELMNGSMDGLADRLGALAGEPGLMRTPDGRIYLSAFLAERPTARQWSELLDALKNRGWQPYFFPVFLDIGKADASTLALADMISIWTGNNFRSLPGLPDAAAKYSDAQHAWCEPIWPQDFRPKDGWYSEASNSLLFRKGWEQAVSMNSQAVDLLTWNDYSEGSEIRPSTSIQYSYYDLAAYYIAWYKSGQLPQITRDVLYYFYRPEASSGPSLGIKQSRPMFARFDYAPTNDIELLAFLTKPGRLTIRTSSGVVTHDAPGGISSLRAPLVPGYPHFELHRHNKLVISINGKFKIRTSSDYQDLLYRGGSSAR